jgi:hypothetical protein
MKGFAPSFHRTYNGVRLPFARYNLAFVQVTKQYILLHIILLLFLIHITSTIFFIEVQQLIAQFCIFQKL